MLTFVHTGAIRDEWSCYCIRVYFERDSYRRLELLKSTRGPLPSQNSQDHAHSVFEKRTFALHFPVKDRVGVEEGRGIKNRFLLEEQMETTAFVFG